VAASIAYGGSTLVRDLISKGLLDELHLFVNPTAIGAGLPVFPGIYSQLQLVTARPFVCGVTALQYQPSAHEHGRRRPPCCASETRRQMIH